MWTNFVKAIGYFILVCGFISGIIAANEERSLLVLLIFWLATALSVCVIMMLAEMSDNIADCRRYLMKLADMEYEDEDDEEEYEEEYENDYDK